VSQDNFLWSGFEKGLTVAYQRVLGGRKKTIPGKVGLKINLRNTIPQHYIKAK